MENNQFVRWLVASIISLCVGCLAAVESSSAASLSDEKEGPKQKKPTELSVPFNEISIEGKKVPLTIETLAGIQRLAQESELKKRVLKILDDRDKSGTQQVDTTNVSESKPQVTDPVKKETPSGIRLNTVMSVYGIPPKMWVEVYGPSQKISVLEVGGIYQDWIVNSINHTGVELRHRSTLKINYVPVGRQIGVSR